MNLRFGIFLLFSIFFVCCQKDYDPDAHLSPQEQYDQVWKIIRYIGRAPENLSFEERFYEAYDPHYREQLSLHRLDAYYIEPDGTHFFLISRGAPSLVEKRVATGGKLNLDSNGKLVAYEEVFRTWKMVPDTLTRKSILLFDKMVRGESLEPFLTRNSVPEEYIEFPDDHTYFDKAARTWKAK